VVVVDVAFVVTINIVDIVAAAAAALVDNINEIGIFNTSIQNFFRYLHNHFGDWNR
jgi:hypothetical protein